MGTQGQLAFDTAPAINWNPYYVVYARSLGRTPDEQIEIDRASVSRMTNYMLWNRAQWRAWATEAGRRNLDFLVPEERESFGVWLEARFP